MLQPDAEVTECSYPKCEIKFTLFQRRHHCRKCGEIFCLTHSPNEIRIHPITLQFSDNQTFPEVRGCPDCKQKFQEWLMRKRNRQNSVKSDCIGGDGPGVLIRRSTSQTEDRQGTDCSWFMLIVAFAGVAAASVPRDWTWSTF